MPSALLLIRCAASNLCLDAGKCRSGLPRYQNYVLADWRWDNALYGSRNRDDEFIVNLNQSPIECTGAHELVEEEPGEDAGEVEISADLCLTARRGDLCNQVIAADSGGNVRTSRRVYS